MNSPNYGDCCAEFYDDIYGPPQAAVVRSLCSLARGGSVLELGLATGRIALALAQTGLAVTGIESSRAMLDQLRRKPGADAIRVVEGDFAKVRLEERFDLIFVIVNTFCLLQTRAQQIACLHNVAAMLKPDGLFLLEATRPCHPDDQITVEGIRSSVRYELPTRVGLRVYEVDLLYPEVETLDALAADAGLLLQERLGSWSRSAYLPSVGNHISVYARDKSSGSEI